MSFEAGRIEINFFDNEHSLIFAMRDFVRARRQFAVSFDSHGRATLAAPTIADRSPAAPQPEPPRRMAA